MTMTLYPGADLPGDYVLRELSTLQLDGSHQVRVGLVRFAQGVRSPAEGMRAGADHEIGYVVSGKVRIDMAGRTFIASQGDALIASPDIAHATTALDDSVIFFALVTGNDAGK